MTITTAQIRGARGILNWSQHDLSERTGISSTSIGSIENGQSVPRENTLNAIRKAFEDAGIEFMPGSGLRMRNEMMQIMEGDEALDKLNDDIFTTLSVSGGEVLIFGLEEKIDQNSPEFKKVTAHLDRIHKAGITERILCRQGDQNFLAPKEYYRWIKNDYFSPHPFFIYGNKLAMVGWGPPRKILIIENPLFSSTFKKVFNFVWERAEKITN